MRDTEREGGRDTGRGRSRLHAGSQPNVGLDPWSPGSHPRMKALLNRWATTGAALLLLILCTIFTPQLQNTSHH